MAQLSPPAAWRQIVLLRQFPTGAHSREKMPEGEMGRILALANVSCGMANPMFSRNRRNPRYRTCFPIPSFAIPLCLKVSAASNDNRHLSLRHVGRISSTWMASKPPITSLTLYRYTHGSTEHWSRFFCFKRIATSCEPPQRCVGSTV